MKRTALTLIIIMVSSTLIDAQKSKSIYADVTFATRSIWHGWDINSNKAVLHPYLEYSIAKTGLSLATWSSLPVDRSLKVNDDIEFMLKFNKSLFKEQVYKTSINSFIDYIVCPNSNLFTSSGEEHTKMLWKYNLGFTLPSLIKVGKQAIIPGYNLYYIFPFGEVDFKDGSVHELSGYYTIPILTGIKIGSTVNYHTGVFGGGSGWTHATSTISSSVKLGVFNINGAINKQWSFDQRTDIADEFWASFGINTKF